MERFSRNALPKSAMKLDVAEPKKHGRALN